MTSRRRFVPLIAFFAAGVWFTTGCGIVGGDSPTPTPTSTSTPTVTSTPTKTATQTPTETPTSTPSPEPTATPEPQAAAPAPPPPPPPAAAPAGIVLPRGRTLTLSVGGNGAARATLGFRGDLLEMAPDGNGNFWRVVGASAGAAMGDFDAIYRLYDSAGNEVGSSRELVSVTYTEYPVEYITLPPGQLEGITPVDAQTEINIRRDTFAIFTPQKLWNGPFIFPVPGPITAIYGEARSFNGGPVGNHHSGTDFGGEEGSLIVAAASGRVAFAGYLATRGNSVIIDHGAGVFTGYHHMSRIDVVQGAEIAQGAAVGGIGATGLATGPHLHWELIVAGVNVDPVFWTYAGVAP